MPFDLDEGIIDDHLDDDMKQILESKLLVLSQEIGLLMKASDRIIKALRNSNNKVANCKRIAKASQQTRFDEIGQFALKNYCTSLRSSLSLMTDKYIDVSQLFEKQYNFSHNSCMAFVNTFWELSTHNDSQNIFKIAEKHLTSLFQIYNDVILNLKEAYDLKTLKESMSLYKIAVSYTAFVSNSLRHEHVFKKLKDIRMYVLLINNLTYLLTNLSLKRYIKLKNYIIVILSNIAAYPDICNPEECINSISYIIKNEINLEIRSRCLQFILNVLQKQSEQIGNIIKKNENILEILNKISLTKNPKIKTILNEIFQKI
ncbi:MAG: hypothetical protein MHMPM18_002546 [Marteilia pararefringens]